MFENALIESGHKTDKQKLKWIPVALVVHAVALVSVVVAQYWTVDPVPEPPIQVSFGVRCTSVSSSAEVPAKYDDRPTRS